MGHVLFDGALGLVGAHVNGGALVAGGEEGGHGAFAPVADALRLLAGPTVKATWIFTERAEVVGTIK